VATGIYFGLLEFLAASASSQNKSGQAGQGFVKLIKPALAQ